MMSHARSVSKASECERYLWQAWLMTHAAALSKARVYKRDPRRLASHHMLVASPNHSSSRGICGWVATHHSQCQCGIGLGGMRYNTFFIAGPHRGAPRRGMQSIRHLHTSIKYVTNSRREAGSPPYFLPHLDVGKKGVQEFFINSCRIFAAAPAQESYV